MLVKSILLSITLGIIPQGEQSIYYFTTKTASATIPLWSSVPRNADWFKKTNVLELEGDRW